MICPHCGSVVYPGNYCQRCGRSLETPKEAGNRIAKEIVDEMADDLMDDLREALQPLKDRIDKIREDRERLLKACEYGGVLSGPEFLREIAERLESRFPKRVIENTVHDLREKAHREQKAIAKAKGEEETQC